jgi:uncharacterized OsmC-like protein
LKTHTENHNSLVMKQTLFTVLNALASKISSCKKSSALLVVLLLFVSGNIVGQTTLSYPYSGANQTFVVPAGVTSISVKIWGAGGGGSGGPSSGGSGAFVKGTLAVTPGQSLVLVVGGAGTYSTTVLKAGGFGGGGAGRYGGSGGGYSGIFNSSVSFANALAIAGGGGGGGYHSAITYGGAGGATTATNAGDRTATTFTGGRGATVSAGGAGGAGTFPGTAGSALTGGAGGVSTGGSSNFFGGGGGGGYYGGGGGFGSISSSNYSSGGGGGSSYLGSMTTTTNTIGVNSNGTTTTATQAPGSAESGYVASIGNGGASATSGNNGLITITYTVQLPTCVAPTAQPTSLSLTSITATTLSGSFVAASPAPSGYLVVRSTSSTPPSPVNSTTYAAAATTLGTGTYVITGNTTTSSATTFSDSSLTANTQYYYYVISYNSSCSGAPYYLTTTPLSANATTCLATPATPTAASITSDGYTANWVAVTGATGYSLEVSTNAGFTAAISGSPFSVSSNSYALSGLTSGNTYYYRVTATGGGCTSVTSASASTLLVCATPTSLAATPTSATQTYTTIAGTFTAATTPPTGYLVVRTTTNAQPTALTAGTGVPAVASTAFGVGTYVEYSNTTAGSWTSTGLTAGNTYYYWVFSYNNTACTGPVYSASATSFSQSTASCPTFASTIAINGTTAVPGTSYPTLTAAIADMKVCGISQATVLELSTGYIVTNEIFPITLGSISGANATNTITIREASNVSGTNITSANTTATIDINGGNYWIIDGRSGGTGTTKDLTISNTSIATGGTAVRFINEASNNSIIYSKFVASYAALANGVINFGSTTGLNGNDNNTIDNNSIDGNGTCAIGIYSAGTTTSTATNNSGNIVSNNNIFNNFAPAINSQGIFLDSGSTDWTINANSFYQTATRTITAGGRYCGIEINSSGNNFTVSNNFIGGSSATCTGTAIYTSTVAARYRGISLKLGTTTASTITGNTINGWNVQSSSGAAATPGVFVGIYLTTGSATIGSALAPNTIGATTGTGGIVTSTSGNGGLTFGIACDAASPAVVTITNNNIGSINTIGTTTSISHSFTGIETSGTASYVINANLIGSTTTVNSINASNASTGTTAQFVNGINNFSTGTSVAITNNTIANLNNAYVPSSPINSSVLRGIVSSSGTNTITGNTIRNLSTATNTSGTTSAIGVIGISMSSTTGLSTVTNNSIYAIANTNATSIQIAGIYFAGGTTNNIIARNSIYNLGTSYFGATVYGIYANAGTSSFSNNNIRLGYDASGAAITIGAKFYGIYDGIGTNNYYHNTIYIGGTGVLTDIGNFSTAAFYSTVTTGTRANQNNIFINNRSNDTNTGKHYAEYLSGMTGLTNNYNIYLASGTGGILGFLASDRTTLSAWQTATTQDANSKNSDPCLNNPTAVTPDLHLTNCSGTGSPAEAAGVTIATITDDIDGETRSSLTPNDIGADAGSYGAVGSEMGATALVSPTQGGCKTATESVIVRVKNNSSTTIDFSANPVTVSATCSLGSYTSSTIVNSGTLAAGATQDVTMDATIDMTTNGTYTFNASTLVTGDVNTNNDAMTAVARSVNSLGGTYTVGSGRDYATLTAAVAAFNTATCITGPVIFSLTDASYTTSETFPITINSNSYASSSNTLTIKPASNNTTTISGSSASSIIKLNGADYVTIDGSNSGGTDKNLTISNTYITASTGSVIWVASKGASDGATNNTIKNCNISGTGPTTAKTYAGILSSSGTTYSSAAEAPNSNNSFTNNNITAVNNGIVFWGNASNDVANTISNNIIGSATSTSKITYTGIYISNQNSLNINSNTVSGIYYTASISYLTGIYVAGTIVGGSISKNSISDVKNTTANQAYGIMLNSSSTTGNVTLSNNIIYDINCLGTSSTLTNGGHGIVIAAGGGYNIYYNTVNLNTSNSSSTSTGITAALYVASGVTGLDIRNNIFANTQTLTTRYAIYSAAANTAFSTINYNNYYSTDTNVGYLSSARSNLAGIVSGFGGNANSTTIQPNFVSTSDLHLKTGANDGINNLGTPIGTTTNDYDGDVRDSSTPDMGADEFTPAPAFTLSASTATICTGTPSSAITISSGSSDYDTFSWTNNTTVSGNATNGWTFNPATTTTYTLTATNSGNSNSRTATVVVTVNDVPSPITFTPTSTTICNGNVQSIVASGGTISSSNNATFGNGLLSNGTTTFPNPLLAWYGGAKHQMLVTAAELTAQGLVSGSAISSVKFDISAFTAVACTDFTIRMGHTANTALSAFVAGTSTVYGPTTFTPSATGLVTFTFTSPFTWNGTSNVILETVHNAGNGGNGATTTVKYTTTATNTVYYGASDSVTNGIAGFDALTTWTNKGASASRPNMIFGITSSTPTTLSWNNTSSLFLNTGATTAYSGNPRTVYAKPSDTTTYTATATAANGCTKSNTIEIAVNPLPTALILTGSAACSGSTGTITSSTSVSGVNYQLYNSSNVAVGSAIAGTDSGLTWSSIAIGTDYYVKATNATTTCVSANSNAVAVGTNPSPTALVLTGSAVCAGSTGSLTSSTSVSGINYQLYNSSNVAEGSAIAGTDSGLTWSSIAIGTGYYVKATNATTSCISANSNAVAVGTNPNPTALVLSGSAACSGSTGTITSSTSVSGVDYQLYDSSNALVGSAIPGTGSGLSWSSIAIGTGYYVKATNTITTCESANSNAVAITTITDKTWIGTTDNSWNTASNWSCGILPSSTDVIIISSGSPVLDTNFTVDSTGSLTISGSGTLTINSTKTLTISGAADFGGKSVTLKSDATGNGTIGQVTGTLTGANNVTVERYVPFGKRAYRLLTPSVTTNSTIYNNWQIGGLTTSGRGTHITGSTSGANGFDLTASGNPSMYTYENNIATGTGWLAIPNTDSTALTAGMGYRTLVRGDRNVDISLASTDNMNVTTTLSASGTLKVGNVIFNSSSTPALNNTISGTSNPTTNDFSLIGNPYASPVDWHLVTKVNVGETYYTWDPNMGTAAQRGRYVAYDITSGRDIDESAVRQYIQPGQAIFVKTTAASPVLTFKEADKASTFTNVFRTNESNSRFSISVYNPTEVAFAAPIDGTTAVFGTNFTSAVGLGDVEKLSSAGENIAWSRATKLLAIDAQAPAVANDELLLKTMRFSANKSYTFKINATNFDNTLSAFLVDQYLNTQTQVDLTAPNFVTFATTADAASYGTDRFKVVFIPSSALNNEEWNSKSLRIYPNPVADNQFTIAVSSSITDKVAITIYNMIGQSVYKESAAAINNAIVVRPTVLLKAGVYMVEMVNNGKTSTQKIIIK